MVEQQHGNARAIYVNVLTEPNAKVPSPQLGDPMLAGWDGAARVNWFNKHRESFMFKPRFTTRSQPCAPTARRQGESDSLESSSPPRTTLGRQRGDVPQAENVLGIGPAPKRSRIDKVMTPSDVAVQDLAGRLVRDGRKVYDSSAKRELIEAFATSHFEAAAPASPQMTLTASHTSGNGEPNTDELAGLVQPCAEDDCALDEMMNDVLARGVERYWEEAVSLSAPKAFEGIPHMTFVVPYTADNGAPNAGEFAGEAQPHPEDEEQDRSFREILDDMLAGLISTPVASQHESGPPIYRAFQAQTLRLNAAEGTMLPWQPRRPWQQHSATQFDFSDTASTSTHGTAPQMVQWLASQTPATTSTTFIAPDAADHKRRNADGDFGSTLAQSQHQTEDDRQELSLDDVMNEVLAGSDHHHRQQEMVSADATVAAEHEGGPAQAYLSLDELMDTAPKPIQPLYRAKNEPLTDFETNRIRELCAQGAKDAEVRSLFPSRSRMTIYEAMFNERFGCNRNWNELTHVEKLDVHSRFDKGMHFRDVAKEFKLKGSVVRDQYYSRHYKVGPLRYRSLTAEERKELEAELMSYERPNYEALHAKYRVSIKYLRNRRCHLKAFVQPNSVG